MPFIQIDESPLSPGVTPVEIYYREYGTGRPLVFLHGGWGYEVYPFDSQIRAFGDRFRIIIPDRTGYGKSMRIETMPPDFHQRAATETLRLIEALKLDHPVLWGHSDGAVIAVMMGLRWPDRLLALVLEALHYYRLKPGSREFFETMSRDPGGLGDRVCAVLSTEHGKDYWQKLIVMNGRAWLALADESREPGHDLYDGALARLTSPTLLIHGSRDPRTEPGEIDAVRGELPKARIEVLEGAGHSPHSAASSAEDTNRAADRFLTSIGR